MNEITNTPLEKGNKEHYVNLGVCKAMNDENNGREVHASTPVETRCTRNDNDQLRKRSGWKMEGGTIWTWQNESTWMRLRLEEE